jgi:hypothetical protein
MADDFPRAGDISGDPKPWLVQFIGGLEGFIDEVVRSGTDRNGQDLFVQNLLASMRLAFNQSRPAFNTLRTRIAEMSDDRINEHALSGDSLRFKFAVVNERVDQFRTHGGVGLFRRALDTIEGLLDSIIDAAGTGGAIKELKEAIRNSTKD